MLDVTKEEQMDVHHQVAIGRENVRATPERKPYLKFGVSAILGLEQAVDDAEEERLERRHIDVCVATTQETRVKTEIAFPVGDKDLYGDVPSPSGGAARVSVGGGGGGGGSGVGGGTSAAKTVHPYLHSYFNPLIHASANKQMFYASKCRKH